MNIAYSRLRQIFKRFNKHSFTWEDVLRICKRYSINIVYVPMIDSVKGYYVTTLRTKYRKKYIVLNEKLSKLERLFVALHELIHHFLHTTGERQQTFYCRAVELTESKEESEARALALMMMYPKARFLELAQESLEHLSEYEEDLLIQRKWVYQNHRNLEDQ